MQAPVRRARLREDRSEDVRAGERPRASTRTRPCPLRTRGYALVVLVALERSAANRFRSGRSVRLASGYLARECAAARFLD
eukprot:6195567-Pleurochrysis_carterae.AAC.1